MIDDIKDMIIRFEGLRLKPYRCPAGKITIGVGRNLEDKGISREEALTLLENDIFENIEDLRIVFENWDYIDESRQMVLIDMRHNLGPGRFRTFKKMIAAVRIGDYDEAAEQIADSRYFIQTGHRAAHNYRTMKGMEQ